MKRNLLISSIIILLLLSACNFDNGNTDKGQDSSLHKPPSADAIILEQYEPTTVEVPYEPTNIKANVAPYKVNADLSNIENLQQLGGFSKEQLELIKKTTLW